MARGHYNVAPRYSAGSPAQVDERTALGVIKDEQRAFAATLEGIYGAEAVEEAKTKGLAGIVEYREEKADHWLVTDLITLKVFVRLFPEALRDAKKAKRISARLYTKYHWRGIDVESRSA